MSFFYELNNDHRRWHYRSTGSSHRGLENDCMDTETGDGSNFTLCMRNPRTAQLKIQGRYF